MDAKLRRANARDLRSGVEDVNVTDAHTPSLLIEYDADLVTGAELVNSLYRCELPVRLDR